MNKLKYIILGNIIPIFFNLTFCLGVDGELYLPHIHDRTIINKLNEFLVTATMYYPIESQTDSTPSITADNTKFDPDKATEYRYVALSRNLLKRWGGPFDYDDIVLIDGIGEYSGLYKVKDTMNRKFKNRVDILTTKGTGIFKYNGARLSLWEGN